MSEPIHVLASNWPKPKMTEAELGIVVDALDNLPQSEETKIFEEIQKNPDMVNENVERVGYTRAANIEYDSEEGITKVIPDRQTSEEKDIGDMSEDEFIESQDVPVIDFTITEDDVRNHPDTMVGDFDLSEMATLSMVKVINKYKETKEDITFNELPEEVQEHILHYMEDTMNIGRNEHTPESHQTRNALAATVVREYFKLIEIDKYVDEYNYKTEHLFDDTVNEMSPIFKQYNDSQDNYYRKLIESTDDPEQKKLGEDILASINDAFNLERLLEAAPRTRIKKFDIDKPKRVFDSFHTKYANPKYHIYNLYGSALTLGRHMYMDRVIPDQREARDTAVKLILLFCSVCKNYSPEKPEQHSFMYYFTYNLYLLDIYQGEQYEEFTKLFFANIKKVTDAMKK